MRINHLEPTCTWAIVEAGWKCEDILHWADVLGGIDVLALNSLEETVSPAAVLDLGIPVGLGTDGGMANDTYDLFVEMRLAALLQKVARRDPSAITPETVLDMATVNGGRALQLPIGRLTPGSFKTIWTNGHAIRRRSHAPARTLAL